MYAPFIKAGAAAALAVFDELVPKTQATLARCRLYDPARRPDKYMVPAHMQANVKMLEGHFGTIPGQFPVTLLSD